MMNLARILQVVVVIATIGCSCCSAQLACSGSQLDDIVRGISKTRFEARDTKPKLARCHKFVGLIREQKELESAGFSTGEPRGQLGEISKILEQRASCPGRPLGGLNSLQEFIEDCQELIELVSGAKGPASSESESFRAVDDETKRLRDSLVEQSEAARRLADQNAKLVRERVKHEAEIQSLEEINAKLSGEFSDLRDQFMEQTKATHTAVQAAVPGTTSEIVIRRDGGEEIGLFWSGDIYGGVFVTQVMANSPAARAGLRFGDQLIQVNGRTTTGRSLDVLIQGPNPVKLLIRKSPMEQTFVLKPEKDEGVPGFVWSKSDLRILDVYHDRVAARAGLLKNFKLIAVNGESVIGLDGATMTSLSWWPRGSFTVTTMPIDFYTKLTEGFKSDSFARVRAQMNKILADEEAGRY